MAVKLPTSSKCHQAQQTREPASSAFRLLLYVLCSCPAQHTKRDVLPGQIQQSGRSDSPYGALARDGEGVIIGRHKNAPLRLRPRLHETMHYVRMPAISITTLAGDMRDALLHAVGGLLV